MVFNGAVGFFVVFLVTFFRKKVTKKIAVRDRSAHEPHTLPRLLFSSERSAMACFSFVGRERDQRVALKILFCCSAFFRGRNEDGGYSCGMW
jgi:hypothetical protein